jgi:hypothetical protein
MFLACAFAHVNIIVADESEPLEGCLFSNYYGFHLHDADVPFHRLAFLDHISHIYGFAVLKL